MSLAYHGRQQHRIAALILAAGLSRRTAPMNKLLAVDIRGETIVSRAVAAAEASRASPIFVVTGYQAGLVADALDGRAITLIHAANHRNGLAASLRTGVASLPEDIEAAIICLGDMPLITAEIIDTIIAAYDPVGECRIVIPTHRGRRGNPVLWDRRFFPDILALEGDAGARRLLSQYAPFVREMEVGSNAVLTDFDTPEALARLARQSADRP